jgi:hypothetical protein
MPLLFLSLSLAIVAFWCGRRRLAVLLALTGVLIGFAEFLYRFHLPPGTYL